jgi:histidine triad (HIT) family protein
VAEKTLFQKIADREITAEIVYEDDLVVAFRDIQPVAPTHVLIVPRAPLARADAAGPEHEAALGRLFTAARRVAADLGITDYRLVVNNGEGAGQSVFHLHMHLLAGRAFAWPPG